MEGDPTLLDVLERLLLEAGLPFRRAMTGEQAIVLDVSPPRGDGFDVVEVLRSESRLAGLPVLADSVHALTFQQRERLKLEPTRFLTKTCSTDEDFGAVVPEMVGQTASLEGEA